MQLETVRIQTQNACGQTIVQFVVFADGGRVGTFGSQEWALAYQDQLWAVVQNKTLEALYEGR